ncbi:family 10 glycosylhydrolase [Roseivirga sp. E12]|uniref:family 10 glycosylhydrolase n=1 Tax=Roseivirga sp. E12 TaxID=2819237 RepID=UPI001ABCD2B5|nr:family 10 glycosylhydrolase [Roseivirga sp. E12]MBO3700455.1 family 10 glycosylhydrolase [Roseivirga sp. E12]
MERNKKVMNKRKFLKQLGLGSFAIAATPTLFSSCQSNPPEDFKLWMWVGGGANKPEEEWREQFTRLSELGFHGVLAGGNVETLKTTVPLAKSLGLEIHSWQWVMNRPGNKEAMAHPEWYAVSRNGDSSLDVNPYVGYYQWLCPSKPEVQDYIINGMIDIAEVEGLDGVQLDYVRYCDVILPRGLWEKYDLVQDHEMPEFDFCYCDTCRNKFKSESGYDPLDLEDPSQDEQWLQFRYDSITNLVNRIAKEVHSRNKKLSASVFATPNLARKFVRQAWDEWDLDFVFPMIYYQFYAEPLDFVRTATAEGVKALGGSKPLYTAQYLSQKTTEDVTAMIEAAKAGGSNGLAFYDYGLLNEDKAKVLENLRASK